MKRLRSVLRSPLEIFEEGRDGPLSADSYILHLAAALTAGSFVFGFAISHCQFSNPSYSPSSDAHSIPGVNITAIVNIFRQLTTSLILGSCVGAFLGGPLCDALGRRKALLCASAADAICIVWYSLSLALPSAISALFFIGIASGASIVAASIFICEISPKSMRGQALSLLWLSQCAGALLSTVFSSPYIMRVSLAIPLISTVCQLLVVLFLPETPHWLLAKKTPTDCSSSLQHFRRSSDIKKEFSDMYRALSSDARQGDSWVDLSLSRSLRLRFSLALLLHLFATLFGETFLLFLLSTFLSNIGLSNERKVWFSLLSIRSLSLFSAVLSLGSVDSPLIGRRRLILVGSLFSCGLWFVLSMLFRERAGPNSSLVLYSLPERGLCLLVLSLLYLSVGTSLSPVSTVFSAELFPFRARGKLVSLCLSLRFGLSFFTIKLLERGLDDRSFFTFCCSTLSAMSLLGFLIIYVFLPETRRLLLEDMEQVFFVHHTEHCLFCLPPLFPVDKDEPRCTFRPLGLRSLTQRIPRGQSEDGLSLSLSLSSSQREKRAYGAVPSLPPRIITTSTVAADEEEKAVEEELWEPSALHKYSLDMRETRFITEAETEEEVHDFVDSLYPLTLQPDPRSLDTVISKQNRPTGMFYW